MTLCLISGRALGDGTAQGPVVVNDHDAVAAAAIAGPAIAAHSTLPHEKGQTQGEVSLPLGPPLTLCSPPTRWAALGPGGQKNTIRDTTKAQPLLVLALTGPVPRTHVPSGASLQVRSQAWVWNKSPGQQKFTDFPVFPLKVGTRLADKADGHPVPHP